VIFISLFLFDLGFEYEQVKTIIENQEFTQHLINVSGLKKPWEHESEQNSAEPKNAT